MKKLLFVVIVIIAIHCEKETEIENRFISKNLEYNDTIDLGYGNCINDYNQTSFCFDSVITDSRCPENVICVWAGEAIVRFRIIYDKNEPVFIDLHTGTIDTIVYDYKISFLDLLPYPNTERERELNDYKAKVIIRKY